MPEVQESQVQAPAELPERSPPPAAPDDVLRAAQRAYRDGNALALWDLLPPAYTTRWEAEFRTYFATTSPQTFQLVDETLQHVYQVMAERGSWIADVVVAQHLAEDRSQAEELTAIFGELCGIVCLQITQDQQRASKLDAREVCFGTGQKFLALIQRLGPISSQNPLAILEFTQVAVDSQTEDTAVLRLTQANGTEVPLHLRRIDECWVPTALVLQQEMQLAQLGMSELRTERQQALRNRQYNTVWRDVRDTFAGLRQEAEEEAFKRRLESAGISLLTAMVRLRRLNSGLSTIDDLVPPQWVRIQFEKVLDDELHAEFQQKLPALCDDRSKAILLTGIENGHTWFDLEPVTNLEILSAGLVLVSRFAEVQAVDPTARIIHMRTVSR